MEVQIIECSKIEEQKVGKELRTFSREFAVKVAESIKVEGLLQPILVRPNPEKPEYYIRVDGKHRQAAVQKILKEQFIACHVLQNFDPKDHEMSQISANLWRNPLTKDQMALSIKKWYEYFANKHGERSAIEVARAAKKAKSEAKAEPEQADDPALFAKLANREIPVEPEATEANFVENVAQSTGTSPRTASRLVRIAKMFSEDELETFRQCYVIQDDQERIAKVKDATLRSQIVSLVASGMTVDDSFKEVLGDQAPLPKTVNEAKAARDEAKVEQSPALTDDEWYETYCGEKAALIAADTAKFKSDSLFYRAIAEARNVFHAKVKKALAAHKLPAGGNGPFYHLVKKVANVSGPKDWFLCSGCGATGVNEDGKHACDECYKAGYKVRAEDY